MHRYFLVAVAALWLAATSLALGQTVAGNGFVYAKPDNQTIVAPGNVFSTTSAIRTAASPTVGTGDMSGTIFVPSGTITIPAISTGLFDSKQTLLLVNTGGSAEPISTTLTINPGGNCVTANGIPAGYAWQLQSNNSTIDCLQIASTVALAQLTGLGTNVSAALALNLSAAGGLTTTVASGTSAMGTGAISSAACATVVTTAATNTATTDSIVWGFNGDPTAVTGYVPATTGMLTIIDYPSANNVNFKVCNNTSGSITPGAITLNWRVLR